MGKWILKLLLLSALTFLQTPYATALSSRTEDSVRAATFEFLSQSTDLRRESLVGSAFAIGPNEFVTTAHLLDGSIGSHFARPVLIDQHRVAYKIANILRYSGQRDYVSFSLEFPPAAPPLSAPRDSPDLSNLYFAGWRADGIVSIGRGAFAGSTPDEPSHDFGWLRFSGPIWNSSGGGPLLDNAGRVVGIIQARAREVGANYATPIEFVLQDSQSVAQIHAMDMLRALMPTVMKIEPLKAEITLPISFDEFSANVQQLRREYIDRMVRPLLEATRGDFTLEGTGAAEACQLLNGRSCKCKGPGRISGSLILDHSAEDHLLLRVHNGENVSQKIAGVIVSRSHSQSAAKTSSKSADQQPYVDYHDRAWSVRTWPVEHSDLVEVSLTRRLPDGYVSLTRTAPTALSYAATLQTEFIANLIYYGCEELPAEGVALVAQR